MLISNQYQYLMRFQFNKYEYIIFNDSDTSLKEVAEYLQNKKYLIIEDIKVYQPEKTRFVKTNKSRLRNAFEYCTELDIELKRRNFYGLTGY